MFFRSAFVIALAAVAGCAGVNAHFDYERAAREVEQAVGHAPDVEPEAESLDHEASARLLEGGLSVADAVQLTLINHPSARALLLQVGMARADIVQAGLWSNPTVGFSIRLPEGGGLSNVEASLAQNIADLWMIPARSRAASRELDRTVLRVAREIVALAMDTKTAYFNSVAAADTLAIARDNVALTKQLLAITQARLEAGTIGSLDVNLARGQTLQAQAGLYTARIESASARRTLATLIGLTVSAADINLTDTLPEPSDRTLRVDGLVEVALDSRLDARASREAVEAAAARVEFELASVFKNVGIGLGLERGERRAQPGRKVLADTARASIANGQLTVPQVQSRGARRLEKSQKIEAILGPSLSLTLPIFDQNQAQITKARMTYLASKAMMQALDRSIVQETREAADRLATAWQVAVLYEKDVLPQVKETLKLSKASYQAGNTPILNMIDAQRSLLEVRRANVAALQNAANAIVDLERATARPAHKLFEAMDSSVRPTEIKTVEPG